LWLPSLEFVKERGVLILLAAGKQLDQAEEYAYTLALDQAQSWSGCG
jgi:hypothetical protein